MAGPDDKSENNEPKKPVKPINPRLLKFLEENGTIEKGPESQENIKTEPGNGFQRNPFAGANRTQRTTELQDPLRPFDRAKTKAKIDRLAGLMNLDFVEKDPTKQPSLTTPKGEVHKNTPTLNIEVVKAQTPKTMDLMGPPAPAKAKPATVQKEVSNFQSNPFAGESWGNPFATNRFTNLTPPSDNSTVDNKPKPSKVDVTKIVEKPKTTPIIKEAVKIDNVATVKTTPDLMGPPAPAKAKDTTIQKDATVFQGNPFAKQKKGNPFATKWFENEPMPIDKVQARGPVTTPKNPLIKPSTLPKVEFVKETPKAIPNEPKVVVVPQTTLTSTVVPKTYDKVTKLEGDIKLLEQEIQRQKEALEASKRELTKEREATANAKNQGLKDSVHVLIESAKILGASALASASKQDELKGKNAALEAKKTELEGKNTALTKAKNNLIKDKNRLIEENKGLARFTKELKAQNQVDKNEFEAQKAGLQNQIDLNQQLIQQHEAEILALQGQSEQLLSTIQDMQGTIDTLKKSETNLKTVVAGQEKTIATKEQTIRDTQHALDESSKGVGLLNETVAKQGQLLNSSAQKISTMLNREVNEMMKKSTITTVAELEGKLANLFLEKSAKMAPNGMGPNFSKEETSQAQATAFRLLEESLKKKQEILRSTPLSTDSGKVLDGLLKGNREQATNQFVSLGTDLMNAPEINLGIGFQDQSVASYIGDINPAGLKVSIAGNNGFSVDGAALKGNRTVNFENRSGKGQFLVTVPEGTQVSYKLADKGGVEVTIGEGADKKTLTINGAKFQDVSIIGIQKDTNKLMKPINLATTIEATIQQNKLVNAKQQADIATIDAELGKIKEHLNPPPAAGITTDGKEVLSLPKPVAAPTDIAKLATRVNDSMRP